MTLMANPNKQQGTAWERAAKHTLETAGWTVTRLAEGGIYDAGDLHATDPTGGLWIVECKHRERLNLTQAVAHARSKALREFPDAAVAVWWKRTVKQPGNTRRTADGEPSIVASAPLDWMLRQ
jgi:Holliday junction resolvase